MNENQQQPAGDDSQRRPTSLASLQGGANEARLPQIAPGFGSLQSYELIQRQAKLLASSTLVPEQYRTDVVKYNRDGTVKESYHNPAGLPNCVLALNMATRMNADPIMVMQNLVLVEGRPSWSSQWVIAQINNCGRFEPLRFDMIELGKQTIEMEYTEWKDHPTQQGRRVSDRKTKNVEIEDIQCTAWTVQKGIVIPIGVNSIAEAKAKGLPIIKGPRVSIGMAVKEGWYTKTGSKWQTMPDLMLHYRSGSFFGRLHAPELLMGIPSQDEAEDLRPTVVLSANGDGTYGPAEPPQAPAPERTNVTDLRRDAEPEGETAAPPPQAAAQEQPAAQTQQPPQDDAGGTKPETEGAPPAAEAARDDMFGNVN